MARAKRPSDELYNARRRVRRLADRVEKLGDARMAEGLRDLARVGRGVSIETLNSAYQAGKVQYAPQRKSKPTQETSAGVVAQPPKRARTKAPRPKRPSDELYNARKRLRRQADRIERDARTKDATERKLAEGYAKYLRQQAQAGAKLTPEQRKQAIERLAGIRKSTRDVAYGGFRVQRRNAILMQQLNAAGTEGATSSISERKKSVFWAATKGLWPKGSNVPRNERYDLILSHFYNDETSDAKEFRKWLIEKKGTDAQESFGDLQLVYEYVTEELNDPSVYELPEVPYETAMDLIKMAR